MFLFVMHPFDVGDRCEIEAVQVVTNSHVFCPLNYFSHTLTDVLVHYFRSLLRK
jgi:hypothetical protein